VFYIRLSVAATQVSTTRHRAALAQEEEEEEEEEVEFHSGILRMDRIYLSWSRAVTRVTGHLCLCHLCLCLCHMRLCLICVFLSRTYLYPYLCHLSSYLVFCLSPSASSSTRCVCVCARARVCTGWCVCARVYVCVHTTHKFTDIQ
jgi:hypothetical protein